MRWLLFVVTLAACGQSRTELMIGVATDLRAPTALDSAQLVVSRTMDGVVLQQVQWDISGIANQPFNLPGSYGIYSDGDEVRLDVALQGFKGGRPIVSRRAVLNLVEGKTLFFRMGLTAGCVDRTDCTGSQTCVEGVCLEQGLDARQLPDFSDDLTTTLTCASGPMYIDTSNGAPMPLSANAAMCPADLCVEGACRKPLPNDTMGPDGGVTLVPHRYVMDKQQLPSNNTEARQLGLDLNGDATVDNQFGMVIGTLVSMGVDPRPALTTAIDRGTTIALVDFGATDLVNTTQTAFATYLGANPQPPACNGGGDTTCRKHLTGTGSFTISQLSPRTPPLPGAIVNGTLTTSMAGRLTVPTVIYTPMSLDLFAARTRITGITDAGLMTGIVAGAITKTDLDTKVLPAWAAQFDATMKADCPGTAPSCGCTPGTTGNTLHGLFDGAPNNCTISVSEVQNNSLIMSLLAPDINIGGQTGLSVGIGFSAVRADFPSP
jgi:hypothetical protein